MRRQAKFMLILIYLTINLIFPFFSMIPEAQAVPTTPFTPSEVKVLVVQRSSQNGKNYLVSDLTRFGYNVTILASDSAGTSVNFLTNTKTANLQQYDVVILHHSFTTSSALNPVAAMSEAEVAHFTKEFSGLLIVDSNAMWRNETSGGWYGFTSTPMQNIEARLGVDFTDFLGGTGTIYNGTLYRVSSTIPNLPSSIPFYHPSGAAYYNAAFSLNGATQIYNWTATASGIGVTYYQNGTGATGIYVRHPWVYNTEPASNDFFYYGLYGTNNGRASAANIQSRGEFLSRLIAYGLNRDFNTRVSWQLYSNWRIDDLGQPDDSGVYSYMSNVLANINSLAAQTGMLPSHSMLEWHSTNPNYWQGADGSQVLTLLKTTYATSQTYHNHMRHITVTSSPYNTWTQAQYEAWLTNIDGNYTRITFPKPWSFTTLFGTSTGALNLLKAANVKGWVLWDGGEHTNWQYALINQSVIVHGGQQYGSTFNYENMSQINADLWTAQKILHNEYVTDRDQAGISLVNGWFTPYLHTYNYRRSDQIGYYSTKMVLYANLTAEYPEMKWVAIQEAPLYFGHRWADISSASRSGSQISFTVNVNNVPTVNTIGKGMLWIRMGTNTSSTIASVTVNGSPWYNFDDYTIKIPAANSNIVVTLGTPSSSSPRVTAQDGQIIATTWSNRILTISLTGRTGMTIRGSVNVGNLGEPRRVTGASTSSFSGSVLSFTIIPASPEEVEISWETNFPSQGQTSLSNIYLALSLASIAFLVIIAIGVLAMIGGSMTSVEMVGVVATGLAVSIGLFIILIVTNSLSSI